MMHAGKRKQKGRDTSNHIDETLSDSIQLFNNTSSGSPVSSRTRSRTKQKDKTVQDYSKNQYRRIQATEKITQKAVSVIPRTLC